MGLDRRSGVRGRIPKEFMHWVAGGIIMSFVEARLKYNDHGLCVGHVVIWAPKYRDV